MSSRIPDRWLKYSAIGKRITNTPFVAFKCPLNSALSISLPPEDKFGLEDIRTTLPHVSLIIDLTNTKKYYNPEVLRDYGIEHKKILVPGHVVPPESKFREFFQVVDTFIQMNGFNSNKLIGVHCTHGVNRTGLFICSYMICRLGFNYETAVEQFGLARGHNIERGNYLNALKKFEKKPLKFDSVPYTISNFERETRKYSMKSLMDLPPPLMPPHRHRMSLNARVPWRADKIQQIQQIQPLMHLPPPLIERTFHHPRDQRYYAGFNNRPPRGRPPFVAPYRSELRRVKPLVRSPKRRLV